MIIALHNRAMSVILCEGDVFVGECMYLSKCVDESVQKSERDCRNGCVLACVWRREDDSYAFA